MGYQRPGKCCFYSVRSYFRADDADPGLTQWTADYWHGSTFAFTGSNTGSGAAPNGGDCLRVALDAAGDVFVAGPRLTADGDAGQHWNLVKYDGASGSEVWKADVPNYGTTGNTWAILFNSADGYLHILSDADSSPFYKSITRVNPADGATIDIASTFDWQTNGLFWDPTASAVGTLPTHASWYDQEYPQFVATADDQFVNAGAMATGWIVGGSPLYAARVMRSPLPVDGGLVGPNWGATFYADGLSTSQAYSVDVITGGADQLVAVSALPIYLIKGTLAGGYPVGDLKSDLALFDTGLDPGGAPPVSAPPMSTRWHSATYLRPRTQLKFETTTHLWVGCTSSPTIEVVDVSNGTRVFGHLHLQPTSIAIGAQAVVTVGTRKPKSSDVDFV